jgi:G3E family GTPase
MTTTEPVTAPIEFVMIGGFLGAGKTTLIAALAKRFQADGKHVCVVTNDQAAGLVDTAWLQSQGLEVNEVAGSCFCCNFDGLTAALDEFETRQRPDVILAEPVGSCTDLIATIAMPMMERLGGKFVQRPYAVVLKPNHGRKILSGQGGGFSDQAAYIFRKQLEESELILINRIDELSTADLDQLKSQLAAQFPDRTVISLSAKTGQNLDQLYDALQANAAGRKQTMDVDYDVYAAGEAELGWLNATVEFRGDVPLSLDELSVALVEQLRQAFSALQAEPGHLKVLCSSPEGVSVANLIDSDSPTVLSVASDRKSVSIKSLINARVRLSPELLTRQVELAVATVAERMQATAETMQLDSFRPGRPVPTHRTVLSS